MLTFPTDTSLNSSSTSATNSRSILGFFTSDLILIVILRSSAAVGCASATFDSMVKAIFGSPLRKRLDVRKVNETRLKNVAHNVRRIGYLEIMDGIVPHWLRKAV